MIPELGYFSLTLAMVLCVLLFIFPLWGAHTGNLRLMRAAPSLAVGQFILFCSLSRLLFTPVSPMTLPSPTLLTTPVARYLGITK